MKLQTIFAPLILILSACQSTAPQAPALPAPTASSWHTTQPLSPASSRAIEASALRPDRAAAFAQGPQFAISTQGRFATKAAQEIMAAGGNLIDAAVAASFVISVERPQSTGIGGGGFMLFREGKTGKVFAIDFRERAPLRSRVDMYLRRDGQPDPLLSQDGALAVAVPGLVAGLLEIHQKFGKLPRSKVMAASIDLAKNGFEVYPELFEALKTRADVLRKDEAARGIFLDEKGEAWPLGHRLVQTDLAKTLQMISKKGAKSFYRGGLAREIVASSRRGGLISTRDLADYKVKWRNPVRGNYRGTEIWSMPPPSSGGVHVVQFLNFLAEDRLQEKGFLSAESIHLAAAALQSAFADRAKYMGDPDFVKVPVQKLTSVEYSQGRRAGLNPQKARRADEVGAGSVSQESTDTTHLSLMDREGNAIATTQTINGWMGSGVVVPGTGILLNNEMDDFSAAVGASNMFGAIGSTANEIAPKKTPLSSMSPTILIKNGKPVLAVGAPGGTRIISCVAQTILNVLEFDLPLPQAVSSIRYHHQWKPDVLRIDPPGPGEAVVKTLKKMGYDVKLEKVGCNVMAVARHGDGFEAFADPRDIGTAGAN